METRKAYGYVRVSTARQAEEGVSLDAQRARIAAYCVAHGYELESILADEGASGSRADNRPGLQQALKVVCHARGVLVVLKLDRLARSTVDAIHIATRLERCGADLASISEQIDTATAHGRFVFRLFASLGELYRDDIAERTRGALAHKRARGERVSRFAPFGFDLAADGVCVTKNDDEQRVIRDMRAWRQEGASFAAIARELNSREVPAKRGGTWSRTTVRTVLLRAG